MPAPASAQSQQTPSASLLNSCSSEEMNTWTFKDMTGAILVGGCLQGHPQINRVSSIIILAVCVSLHHSEPGPVPTISTLTSPGQSELPVTGEFLSLLTVGLVSSQFLYQALGMPSTDCKSS